MIRKSGTDWEAAARKAAAQRLRSWSFSGMGKWCEPLPGVPYLPVLSHGDVPNVARHPDIFDPTIRAAFAETMRRQIAPQKRDPFVVGWSIGNEYDEIVTTAEVAEILQKPSNVPAKRALIDQALEEAYHGICRGCVQRGA